MVRSNIPSAPYNAAILSGVTASAGEINYNDITTAGTVQASKAVIADANKDVTSFRNVTATGAVQGGTVVGTTSVTGAAVVGTATVAAPAIDAGSSGAAGSVDVFPTTGSKGKLAITATDNTGDTTTAVVAGAQAGARTYTIPDALANAQFLLGMQGAVARTATAAGDGTGAIAAAGMLQFISVTAKTGDATGIITLPTPTPGTIVILSVGATGYELRTTAPGTIGINGGASAAGESPIAANQMAIVICESATNWKGFTIASDGTLAALQPAAD